jgi:hypothetical protein
MADFTNRIRRDVEKRLRELEPAVQEHQELKDLLSKLGNGRGRTSGVGTASSSGTRATPRRRGRPRKGQPTRSDEFLKLVQERPGITVSEAAKQLGIQPNYLYRLRNTLQKQRRIKKQGKGYALVKSG